MAINPAIYEKPITAEELEEVKRFLVISEGMALKEITLRRCVRDYEQGIRGCTQTGRCDACDAYGRRAFVMKSLLNKEPA